MHGNEFMLTKIKIRDASVVELNGRSRRMMMLGTLVHLSKAKRHPRQAML